MSDISDTVTASGLRIMVAMSDDPEWDLSTGDCLADRTGGAVRKQIEKDSLYTFYIEACTEDDEKAMFKDRLYGTRGETPTTVVQWSKGTIF